MGNQMNSWWMNQPEEGKLYRFNNEQSSFILFNPEKYKEGHKFTPNFKVGMLLVDLTDEKTNNVYRQEDFANICGVERQAVMKYLRAKPNGSFTPVPLRVLFNLSRHFNIPLCYFTDNNISYTEKPQDIVVPQDYYHTIPVAIRRDIQNTEVGNNYFNDVSQLSFKQKEKEAKQAIETILDNAGLVPEVICKLTQQSIDNLTTLVQKAVMQVYDSQMEAEWNEYIHSPEYISDIVESGEYEEYDKGEKDKEYMDCTHKSWCLNECPCGYYLQEDGN